MAVLETWVIYDHPYDFPDAFVVRCWLIDKGRMHPTPEVWLRPTVEEARAVIAANLPGGCRLECDPDDDPVIVETWV